MRCCYDGAGLFQGLAFGFEIDRRVAIGGFYTRVSEPMADRYQIDPCPKEMDGRAVPKGIAVLLMICIPQRSAIRCIRSTESKERLCVICEGCFQRF